ncbi:hypothetical protein BT69DRAFT_1021489 [Atractiella rhizophila]|nr:hypothetical protein BT69DRAFT_1021489 [Atractiella rhizophila]
MAQSPLRHSFAGLTHSASNSIYGSEEDDPWSAPASNPIISGDVPAIYYRAWETVSEGPFTPDLSLITLHRFLSHCASLSPATIEKISNLVAETTKARIGKLEFFVSCALTAFAQNGEEVSIENISKHKDNLPSPTFDFSTWQSRTERMVPTRMPSDPWNSAKTYVPNGRPTTGFEPVAEPDEVVESQDGLPLHESWILPSLTEVIVELVPTKEGQWLFAHKVYHITKKGVTVTRRFSDFDWLLDCLSKRYPCRIIPALPPKRFSVSGYHLTADNQDQFLERRRRALQRALTHIANHPVLSKDALVVTFFNEKVELSAWKSNNNRSISLEEEGYSRHLTSEEEMSIPSDFDEKLLTFRSSLPTIIDYWTRICTSVERISKRTEAQSSDFSRVKLLMEALLQGEGQAYVIGPPHPTDKMTAFLNDVAKQAEELEHSAHQRSSFALEKLKSHREIFHCFLLSSARYDAILASEPVEKLNKQVEKNQRKLESLRQTSGVEADVEKVSQQIHKDKSSIQRYLQRRQFNRFAIWSEIIYCLQRSNSFKKQDFPTTL